MSVALVYIQSSRSCQYLFQYAIVTIEGLVSYCVEGDHVLTQLNLTESSRTPSLVINHRSTYSPSSSSGLCPACSPHEVYTLSTSF